MENKAHAMAAGVFVLVVSALLAALALWLMHDNTKRDIYEMSTSEVITGLQPQAAVTFRGVPIGKVESISFDSKAKGNVLVRVSIDQAAPITQSVFATVASQGVTGLSFIQLDDSGESKERVAANNANPPRIPIQSGGLDKILKQSETIFKQVELASTQLNKLLSDGNQKAITGALTSSLTQLGEAAGGITRLTKDLQPTVVSLPALSRDVRSTVQSAKATSDEFGATAKKLNEKGGALDKLSEGGAALAAGVETFSAATLPKLDDVAEEAARTLKQLRRTVNAVDDNPQSLIFGNGPPLPGPGEPGFSANGAKK
jgi:phospholipid/cholesterol/gamma-HCH transport system substrate-binding protein